MKGSFKDLTGQRFGRLTVIKRAGSNAFHKALWICRCECGQEVVVSTNRLNYGDTKSCGCIVKENMTIHGLYRTRLNIIWTDMKQRCYNPNHDFYKHYGGRGISICDEWRNDFLSFRSWALANGYADNLTIDRINPDGNYEPSNCRWATMKEQRANRSQRKLVAS